jgi:predicted small secreted protein
MTVLARFAGALLVCAIASALALGCNTFKGAGKDIQQGGKAVENAADNARSDKGDRVTPHHHTIMASAQYGGTISPVGSTNVAYGSNRTYIIKAHDGYHVADVLVDGVSVGAASRHTFADVTKSHTISASFTSNLR